MSSFVAVLSVFVVIAGTPINLLQSLSNREGRIVGGVETNISEVPYQLALEWEGRQFCAAAILNQKFAISAGHCVYNFEPHEVVVRAGSTSREAGGKIFSVKKFNINQKYHRNQIDYDVAIIELESPIEFDLNSQPIALTNKEAQPGLKALVSGWGSLEERGDAPLHLHSLQISIIDRSTCKESYRNVEEITDRMICAGKPGFDSCKGDSGGPIVLGKRLIGIVSWGKGCGRIGYPGVYTNLANPEIRNFIRNITGI